MANYYVDISVTSHTDDHSSVEGAAYILRERFYDELAHTWRDYRYAHAYEVVIASGTELPPDAPREWSDPEVLWNASELFNPADNARTARRVIASLPDEMTDEECVNAAIALAVNFVAEGMVVTWAVHKNKVPNEAGHLNKHLHLNMTVNPCNAKGFLAKGKTGYEVKDINGNYTLVDAKTIQANPNHYYKLYRYRNEEEDAEEWLTANEAAVRGDKWVRVNKYPKKRKIRATDWDEHDTLLRWRKDIECTINDYLMYGGYEERVSCESYEARGIDRIPTVYEGKANWRREEAHKRKCEAEGKPYTPITERRAYNLRVAEINRQRELADLAYQRRLAKDKSERDDERKSKRKRNRASSNSLERMAVKHITDAIEDSVDRSNEIGRDII